MGKKTKRSLLTSPNCKNVIIFFGLSYLSIYLLYVNNTMKLDNTMVVINLAKCRDENIKAKLMASQLIADQKSINWEQFSKAIKDRKDRRIFHTRPLPDLIKNCQNCEEYDITVDPNEGYDCVPLKLKEEIPICVYREDEDVFISKSIRITGMWEGNIVQEVQNWLERDSELGLIDVGCNIGVYTLAAASLEHDVIAVDPFTEHIKRLHKSIRMNKLQHRVTVLRNAVSDIGGKAEVIGHKNNQGAIVVKQDYAESQLVAMAADSAIHGVEELTQTITLNELVPYCSFSKAILKIDIEGFEHRAFARADLLFNELFIPVVIMEWASMNDLFWKPVGDADRKLVENMIEFLLNMDYTPVDWDKAVLHVHVWDMWPRDMMWVHKTFRL